MKGTGQRSPRQRLHDDDGTYLQKTRLPPPSGLVSLSPWQNDSVELPFQVDICYAQ